MARSPDDPIIVYLLSGRRCRSSRTGVRGAHATDGFAGEHQFHATILLASFGGIVGCHRSGLAQAASDDRAIWNTLMHQVIAHSLRAVLGELHVVVVPTAPIRMPFHSQLHSRIG